MPIEFQGGQSHLAPGCHEATVDEVKVKLVDAFPDSTTRPVIYEQWLELRAAIMAIVPLEKQWLNGSFVSTKLDPNDLDVASFVDGAAVEALSDSSALDALCAGSNNERFPLCDSFLIPQYPPGHPVADSSQQVKEAFETIFYGFDDRLGLAKGFVEVVA